MGKRSRCRPIMRLVNRRGLSWGAEDWLDEVDSAFIVRFKASMEYADSKQERPGLVLLDSAIRCLEGRMSGRSLDRRDRPE